MRRGKEKEKKKEKEYSHRVRILTSSLRRPGTKA
jgi:hypothetical protein